MPSVIAAYGLIQGMTSDLNVAWTRGHYRLVNWFPVSLPLRRVLASASDITFLFTDAIPDFVFVRMDFDRELPTSIGDMRDLLPGQVCGPHTTSHERRLREEVDGQPHAASQAVQMLTLRSAASASCLHCTRCTVWSRMCRYRLQRLTYITMLPSILRKLWRCRR